MWNWDKLFTCRIIQLNNFFDVYFHSLYLFNLIFTKKVMNISKEKLVWMLLIDMLVWILVGVLKMLKMLVETRTLVETLVKKNV